MKVPSDANFYRFQAAKVWSHPIAPPQRQRGTVETGGPLGEGAEKLTVITWLCVVLATWCSGCVVDLVEHRDRLVPSLHIWTLL